MIYKLFIFFLFFCLFLIPQDKFNASAESYVKVPSLKYSTKAVSALDVNVLIADENINVKIVEASVIKQVTKTTRQIALRQQKSEVFEKAFKVVCNGSNQDPENTVSYGCVSGNKRASLKDVVKCDLPKQPEKYRQVQYLCNGGKRAFDVYRITNVCAGTVPTDTVISRSVKKEKPDWSISGEGAKIDVKRGGANIESLSGVFFLTAMQPTKLYKDQSFRDLMVTPSNHPAISGAKIRKFRLNVSGSIGLLEKQSLGKRVRKMADGYCNGGALQLAQAFSGSLAMDLKWALADRKVEHDFSWQGIDLRDVSLNFFNNAIKDANKIVFKVLDISTGKEINTSIKISDLNVGLFDYSYFKDKYLRGIFEDFVIETYDSFENHDFFSDSYVKEKIKSGRTLNFQPNIFTSFSIDVSRRGFKPVQELIEISPSTSEIKIVLVPNKDKSFSENEPSRIIIN